MDAKKSKILAIIVAIISIIGVFFLIRIIMVGDDAIKTDLDLQSSIVDPFIHFSKFLLIITTILVVVFSILNLVKNPQALKKALIGVVALVVLLGIMYVMAPDNAVTGADGMIIKDGEAGSGSQWVSALINFTGVLGVIGLITIALGFVKSLK